MTNHLQQLQSLVSSWPHISLHPHRFGGHEFRFANAELGHLHTDGTLDIPFPRTIRDALLHEGLAQEHPWIPNSGWTTFRLRGEKALPHAVWLLRLSYLRYALKTSSDPAKLFEQENAALQLTPRFKALLERFVPTRPSDLSS